MTETLDIHLATDEERRQAHANCHDVWSEGLPLAEHIARRESSALHARARWIVGCLAGRVIAGLASHPLMVRLEGRVLSGIGIASVHTLPEFRRQGLAPQMLEWIEGFERDRGAQMSVLFCDIQPTFYERLGYILCPAHLGWVATEPSGDTRAKGDAGLYDRYRLVSGGAFGDELPRLAELYQSDHGRRALSIERTVDYWRHLTARRPEAELLWLTSTAGVREGYALLRRTGHDLRIDDHAVRGGGEAARAALLRFVIDMAQKRGMARAGGWLAMAAPANALFEIRPRPAEITMIKPLVEGVAVSPSAIAAADWFQEVDQV